MRQRSRGLEWIDKNDYPQQTWAYEYLQRKGRIDREYRSSTYEYLLREGRNLEKSDAGQSLLDKMKNAWRQKKYRSPDKGRKACTFKLETGVKKELSSLARRNRTNETSLLTTLISDESQALTELQKELRQVNDRHKAQLSACKEETKKHKQGNQALMDLLKNSVAALCRAEILLQDAAPPRESVTQDQQRRIDKRCRQIMIDAEAVVKGQTALLPSELFNLAIRVADSTLVLKEAAIESPSGSNNSPVGNQSNSTEHEFRSDSERLPLPQDHSEPSPVLVAEPYGPGTNNHNGLRPMELSEEKISVSLEKNATGLESRSAPQRLPDNAVTDVASRSNKITLQRKKHSFIRAAQGKHEKD